MQRISTLSIANDLDEVTALASDLEAESLEKENEIRTIADDRERAMKELKEKLERKEVLKSEVEHLRSEVAAKQRKAEIAMTKGGRSKVDLEKGKEHAVAYLYASTLKKVESLLDDVRKEVEKEECDFHSVSTMAKVLPVLSALPSSCRTLHNRASAAFSSLIQPSLDRAQAKLKEVVVGMGYPFPAAKHSPTADLKDVEKAALHLHQLQLASAYLPLLSSTAYLHTSPSFAFYYLHLDISGESSAAEERRGEEEREESEQGEIEELEGQHNKDVLVLRTLLTVVSYHFAYHFESKRETNKLEAPEWAFGFLLKVAEQGQPVCSAVGRSLSRAYTSLLDCNLIAEEYIYAGLAVIAARRLVHDEEKILDDDAPPILVLHAVQELLKFDQKLNAMLDKVVQAPPEKLSATRLLFSGQGRRGESGENWRQKWIEGKKDEVVKTINEVAQTFFDEVVMKKEVENTYYDNEAQLVQDCLVQHVMDVVDDILQVCATINYPDISRDIFDYVLEVALRALSESLDKFASQTRQPRRRGFILIALQMCANSLLEKLQYDDSVIAAYSDELERGDEIYLTDVCQEFETLATAGCKTLGHIDRDDLLRPLKELFKTLENESKRGGEELDANASAEQVHSLVSTISNTLEFRKSQLGELFLPYFGNFVVTLQKELDSEIKSGKDTFTEQAFGVLHYALQELEKVFYIASSSRSALEPVRTYLEEVCRAKDHASCLNCFTQRLVRASSDVQRKQEGEEEHAHSVERAEQGHTGTQAETSRAERKE